MAIITFAKDFHFLSNFYSSEVKYKGIKFPTVENAYQAAKLKDESMIHTLVDVSPGYAKTIGNQIELRNDWENVKEKIMEDLLNQKFTSNLLFTKLTGTHPHYLLEGNYWHDNYWGVCYCKQCQGIGFNKLGNLLMKIRERGVLV